MHSVERIGDLVVPPEPHDAEREQEGVLCAAGVAQPCFGGHF